MHNLVIKICVPTQVKMKVQMQVQVLYLGIKPIQCLFHTLGWTDLEVRVRLSLKDFWFWFSTLWLKW